jgi:tetratricopeptide (TPR) repeat protein
MPSSRLPFTLRSPLNHLAVMVLSLAALGARADELSDVQRLYYAGRAADALQRADQFLVTHPGEPQMLFMKGVMLADARRDAEAIALFVKLTEDHPDLAEPYNNLAALYAAGGDYPKARATLEQALRTNPNYATAHENLGDVHAALAAQSYNRALKLDPRNVTVPPKLAMVRNLYKPLAAAASAPASASTPTPALAPTPASASASTPAPAPPASRAP